MWIKNKIKNIFKRKRFYLVFYIATVDKGHLTSQITSVAHGHGLNKECLIEWLKETYKSDNIRDIVFTNIIELSKSDFEDWNYTKPKEENGI